MRSAERKASTLIEKGMLERCRDFDYNGKKVLASRLGWRINEEFVNLYFGRIFSSPSSIFSSDMLRPELQNMDIFADGMDNMVGAHRRAAEAYFNDGSIEGACPPLKALLYIMKDGHYEGKTLDDPEIREMFSTENIRKSEWYAERLMTRQQIEVNNLQNLLQTMQNASATDKSSALTEEINLVRSKLQTGKGHKLPKVIGRNDRRGSLYFVKPKRG